MKWPSAEEISTLTSTMLPAGFNLRVLVAGQELESLPKLIRSWYADIRVGGESYHLEEQFYRTTLGSNSCFTDTDYLPLVLTDPENMLCGLVSFWKNSRAKHVTSGLGVLAPHVRGKKLAFVGPQILEALGMACGAAQIHYYVTLRNIAQQLVAEKLGFSLAGINPAHDEDAISATESMRVYEAIYAKILQKSDIEIPCAKHLTENVKNLFFTLFPDVTLKD